MAAKRIIFGIGSLCLLVSQWAGAELYNDGGAYNILDGDYDTIEVDNPPPTAPASTTVTFGGTATTDRVEAFTNSQVTIDGGTVGWPDWGAVIAHDNSQMTLNDGWFSYGAGGIQAWGSSRVTIGDNSTMDALRLHDDVEAIMNGGLVRNGFWVDGNAKLAMNGVDLYHSGWGVGAGGNSRVTINGGRVGQLPLNVLDNALVTIVGSDFAVYRDYEATDLVFSGFGDLTSAFDGCFLFGSLSGGAPNNWIELNIQDNGQVSLVPVPGATLLGMLGLSAAGMGLRRWAC